MTTRKNKESQAADLVPAVSSEMVAPGGGLSELAEQLVDQARGDGIALTGEGGLLPQLIARVLETGLAAEMSDHLGYEPHAVDGNNSGNSRNGSFPKTVVTEVGEVDLRVPRDRNGTFDPVLVPHGERRIDGLAGQVISLYAQGLTTGEIRDHLAEQPTIDELVLDLEGVGRLDYTAAAAIGRMVAEFEDAGVTVRVINIRPGAARAAGIHLASDHSNGDDRRES